MLDYKFKKHIYTLLIKKPKNESLEDIYTIYSIEEGHTNWAIFSAMRLNLNKALLHCESRIKRNQENDYGNYIYFIKKVKEDQIYNDIDITSF